MSDTTPKPPCEVCGGKYEDHFNPAGAQITRHMYTENPGELVTPEQKAKQQQRQQTPTRVQMPSAEPVAARLVEVLLEKGLLSAPEALYIAGVGSKPVRPEGSRFRDPAEDSGFYRPTPGGGI